MEPAQLNVQVWDPLTLANGTSPPWRVTVATFTWRAVPNQDVPSSVTSAFQVFRQQYETNKRTMTATILSLCGLLQNRLERFFDTDGIIRKLRSESTAITSRDAASSSCTEERAIQTLWKQLTVLSLTRVLASAYVYCLLQALVCIQVNLLGRYLSLATALARSERYGRRPDSSSPLPTEAALLTELLALPGASQAQPLRQVQRAYLRVARKLGEVNFLETLVTRKLMRAMRSELDERDWDLQTSLRVSDLASLWHGACCRLEKCQDIQAVAVDTTQRVDDIETKQLSPSAEEHSATPVHEREHRKGLWMASILQQLVQESRQSLVVELLRSEQMSTETGSPRFETHTELASRASVTDTSLQQATAAAECAFG
ncbi:hypothetical protein F1559_002527 [Cyanidiococcus yangmingshanensis]|uniref:Uncharacterized protein n=1 Tax=Cyanidiococcus yangmingshanensis TaxID=2690220 RepID=A0A7J7IDG5_9RHOD|nr:hypothetical protein F1559_002527 [Cyanidiococcus yangmingshanensis]